MVPKRRPHAVLILRAENKHFLERDLLVHVIVVKAGLLERIRARFPLLRSRIRFRSHCSRMAWRGNVSNGSTKLFRAVRSTEWVCQRRNIIAFTAQL